MPFIEFLLLSFIAICAVIVVFATFMHAWESYLNRYKISQLAIKKSAYVKLVLNWCYLNINGPKQTMPEVSIKYNKNKKLNGVYISANNELIIYVNNHDSLLNLTNTIIHEYVHSRQRYELKQKNKDPFLKLYSKYHYEIGYEKNPFEYEARDIAKKFERKCLEDIIKQNPQILLDRKVF